MKNSRLTIWSRLGISIMLRAVLFVAFGVSSASMADSSTVNGLNRTVVVPFIMSKHTPFVVIKTGGLEWKFMVDTGSAFCAVSTNFVSRNFLSTNRRIGDVLASDGSKTNAPVVDLPPFWMGSKLFIDQPAWVVDFTTIKVVHGGDCDGVIGFDVFKPFITTVDYRQMQLLLRSTNSLSSIERDNLVRYPYTLSNGVPYITIQIQERELPFNVDSGSSGFLTFPANSLDLKFVSPPRSGGLSISITGVTSKIQGRLDGVVVIGNLRIANPLVTGMPGNAFLLGGQILKYFIVTFDPFNQYVYFKAIGETSIRPSSITTLGINFDRSSSPWRVLSVDELGESALREIHHGDLCTTIEGRPVSDLSWEEYDHLVAKLREVTMEIRRGDSKFIVDVPVVTLVE